MSCSLSFLLDMQIKLSECHLSKNINMQEETFITSATFEHYCAPNRIVIFFPRIIVSLFIFKSSGLLWNDTHRNLSQEAFSELTTSFTGIGIHKAQGRPVLVQQSTAVSFHPRNLKDGLDSWIPLRRLLLFLF